MEAFTVPLLCGMGMAAVVLAITSFYPGKPVKREPVANSSDDDEPTAESSNEGEFGGVFAASGCF